MALADHRSAAARRAQPRRRGRAGTPSLLHVIVDGSMYFVLTRERADRETNLSFVQVLSNLQTRFYE